MKINFYLRKSLKKELSIQMFISFDGNREQLNTGLKTESEKWDNSKQRIKIKYKADAAAINPSLNELEEKAFDYLREFKPAAAIELKRLLIDGPPKPEPEPEKPRFETLYHKFLIDCQSTVNSKKTKTLRVGTINQYKSFLETLKEFETFEKGKDAAFKIDIEKLNHEFYAKFRSYCIIEKNLSPNTFGGKIKRLKTFLNWCDKMEIPVSGKFRSFETPQSYEDAEPLRAKELLDLWELKADWKLDVFLALCTTGMRISDYNEVMTAMDKHIIKTPKGDALVFKSQKTGQTSVIPMHDDIYFRPVHLYNKYEGKMPRLSGQKLNKYLKEIEINKRITVTSKTGRKTMCSIRYYELSMEAQFIMKISGHATELEFKKYIGASTIDVIRAVKENSVYVKAS